MYYSSSSTPPESRIPLPNSRTVWVLGILSLVGALCFALPGLIIAIIALFLSSDDEGR